MSGSSPLRGQEREVKAERRRPGQPRLGRALRRAWVGYQRRLDAELTAAGFGDRGFPDGRVLRICARTEEVSVSEIARELGITRQGAGKIVANLRDRTYVTVSPSITSGREKNVKLTPRAHDYLSARRKASRKIERQLRTEFGEEAVDTVFRLLNALGGEEQPRLWDFLQRTSRSHHHGYLEE